MGSPLVYKVAAVRLDTAPLIAIQRSKKSKTKGAYTTYSIVVSPIDIPVVSKWQVYKAAPNEEELKNGVCRGDYFENKIIADEFTVTRAREELYIAGELGFCRASS